LCEINRVITPVRCAINEEAKEKGFNLNEKIFDEMVEDMKEIIRKKF